MCLYATSQKISYLKNTGTKNTGQRTANIHRMLDILRSRSNKQVHIYEINENVTEKNQNDYFFSAYSELRMYALSWMNEIPLSSSGASNYRLPFRMRPVVENCYWLCARNVLISASKFLGIVPTPTSFNLEWPVTHKERRKRIYIAHLLKYLTLKVWITQCYLQITPYLPLPRNHSPDGASQTEVADI